MKQQFTKSTILWQFALSLTLLISSSSSMAVSTDPSGGKNYTTKDKEYYLTADELLFIRPGLDLEVVDFSIPVDLRPLVTFSIKDPGGLPLDINGVFTPGPVDMRFTLTYIPQGEEQKVRLTIDTADVGGTITALGDGVYTYTFGTILPDTYDPDTTHTLGVSGRRDLREFGLERYADNVVYNFVPSDTNDPLPRDVVTTETCNGRCHDPLEMHGGRYLETGMCTQCHNPGLIDEATGLSFSFNVLIHRVHNGLEAYPAALNDCETCHTGGTPTKNFPLVANPTPATVCDASGYGSTLLSWGDLNPFDIHVGAPDGGLFASASGAGEQATGKWVKNGTEFFLVDRATGATVQKLAVNTTALGCLGNAPYTFRGVAGAQHTNWLDHPSSLVCGSCHDGVDFATGEGHPGGPQADDSKCGNCHRPVGSEFGASVRGSHTVVANSAQLPGVLVNILEVTNTSPGSQPTVKFTMSSRDGPLYPQFLDRLRFSISGPNTDFSFYAQETVDGWDLVKTGNVWSYKFSTPLPANATGSYSVGVEGRRNVLIDMGGDQPSSQRDMAENYTFAFAVTDEVAVPRRMVVDDYKCEGCHRNLALHGGNRHNPQYCVTCHTPDRIAAAEGKPSQSVHFKYMIHKIHRGAELEKGYVIPGSRGDADFADVEFPGDLRNCETCHVNGSEQIPLPDGLLATVTPQELWSPMEPIAAACLACHDSDDAAKHAFANTTVFGESCGNCHGEDKTFSVDKVHAH